MADGRKNNGGYRRGSGAKKRAFTEDINAIFDEVINEAMWKEAILSVYQTALSEGNFKALEALINRRFGKVAESINLNNDQTVIKVQYEKLISFEADEDNAPV